MSHQQGNEAEEMEEEYEMEDADDDMDDEFHVRDAGGSDSDMEEYEYMVRSLYLLINWTFSGCYFFNLSECENYIKMLKYFPHPHQLLYEMFI